MKQSDAAGQIQRISHTLSQKQRLTRTLQFERAYTQNRRFAGKLMTAWFYHDRDSSRRLGVVAGKRVGKAVERNRAKRLLREAFRLNRHAINATFDVILVARRAILNAKRQEVEQELLSLLDKAGKSDNNSRIS